MMRFRQAYQAIIILTALLFATTSNARPEKPSEEILQQSTKNQQKSHPSKQYLFSQQERQLIGQHYSQSAPNHKSKKPKKIPKGLQKKYQRMGEFPHGWQKKIQRGEVIDIGFYQQAKPLPIKLQRHLPAGPLGSKALEVEDKIIRVMEEIRVILDVFDILRSEY